jgi:hypothetical protein
MSRIRIHKSEVRIRTKMSRIPNIAGFTEPGPWIPQRTLFSQEFLHNQKMVKEKYP